MITKEYKPSTQRTQRLRDSFTKNVPSICPERAVIVTKSYKETEGVPPVIRQAMAFNKYLDKVSIYIQDGELIVGNIASRPRSAPIFPEYDHSWMEKEIDTIGTRIPDPYILSDEDKQKLEKVFKYWPGKTYKSLSDGYTIEDCKKAHNVYAINCDYFRLGSEGHLVPGHDLVLTKGHNGIIKEAEEQLAKLDVCNAEDIEKIHFLQAVIISGKAAIKYAKRYADLAREKAAKETEPKRKAELEEIAAICDWVPANPARNFKEALQVVVFNMMTIQMESNGASIAVGRLDQYTYPYYKRDKDAGAVTKEQAVELLECLWLKIGETSRVWDEPNAYFIRGYQTWIQITLGGQTRDKEDATNDLSYLMLDVTANLKIQVPSTSVRLHQHTPDEFLMKCLEVTKVYQGGMPALYNDKAAIEGLMATRQDLTREDIYDWAVVGCVENNVMGTGYSAMSMYGMVNEGKVLEMALYGGKDRMFGIEIGPREGDMTTWKSYDDMMDAIKRQAHLYNKLITQETNILNHIRRMTLPTPHLSAMTRGCIESGRSIVHHGAICKPGAGVNIVGAGTIGNAIAAIKKLVFDDKVLTMEQLKHALETNYEDTTTTPTGPEIQQLCLAAPKYGNDDDYVDKIVRDILNFQADDMRTNTHFGLNNTSGIAPATGSISFGMVVGATPDGRKSGMPMADGISPSQGTDVNGITAAMNSVAKVDHSNLESGTLFNVKVHPATVETEAGMRKWADTVRTFFEMGGYQLQFNVVSADTLKAAQKEPEKHKDLLVRVAGYSAFFVMLDQAVQDDIINRTEHRMMA